MAEDQRCRVVIGAFQVFDEASGALMYEWKGQEWRTMPYAATTILQDLLTDRQYDVDKAMIEMGHQVAELREPDETRKGMAKKYREELKARRAARAGK